MFRNKTSKEKQLELKKWFVKEQTRLRQVTLRGVNITFYGGKGKLFSLLIEILGTRQSIHANISRITIHILLVSIQLDWNS